MAAPTIVYDYMGGSYASKSYNYISPVYTFYSGFRSEATGLPMAIENGYLVLQPGETAFGYNTIITGINLLGLGCLGTGLLA